MGRTNTDTTGSIVVGSDISFLTHMCETNSIQISLPKVFRTMNSTPIKMYAQRKTVFKIVYFLVLKFQNVSNFRFFSGVLFNLILSVL